MLTARVTIEHHSDAHDSGFILRNSEWNVVKGDKVNMYPTVPLACHLAAHQKNNLDVDGEEHTLTLP